MKMLCVSLAVATLSILAAHPARACSLGCQASRLTPSGGVVPANLGALEWQLGFRQDASLLELDDVRVSRVTLTSEEPVPFTLVTPDPAQDRLLIQLDTPLVEGGQYRVVIPDLCGGEVGFVVGFVAGPAAPLPSSAPGALGVIEVGEPEDAVRNVGTNSGSCTSGADVMVARVRLALAADAQPWAAAFVHASPVALDQPLAGDVVHVCESDDPGVDATRAERTLEWSARIPGVAGTFSAKARKVDLSCGCSAAGGSGLALALAALGLLLLRRGAAAVTAR